MAVRRLLDDIMEALKTNHLEHEAIRREMVTKSDLEAIRTEMATKSELEAIRTDTHGLRGEVAENGRELRKLGLEFEAFRHDSRIALEAISELKSRTSRHEKTITGLDRRTRRVENNLGLKPLPDPAGEM